MASKVSIGNALFWMAFLTAGIGAFGAGFWYTYGATVSVNAKSPVDESLRPSPLPTEAIAALPERPPHAEESVAPGPLPVSEPDAGLVTGIVATPVPAATPMAQAPLQADPAAVNNVLGAIAATPVPTPVPTAEVYRVQVGAFDSREQAERQVSELSAVGIRSVVVYDGGRYHAQLGAYADRARAISVADEANVRGYSVVIRH